ncbi:MAG: redox-sensing transcriptional repressor Rex [Chloroflexota bacterium]
MQHRVSDSLIDDFGDSGSEHSGPAGLRADLNQNGIPDIVIRRLPIYARSLKYLAGEGVETVSSGELGMRLGVSAAQIRRDLSYFGEFGKQGKGYNVAYLLEQVNGILQLDHDWPVALVGLGHLGRALLHYEGLSEHGFNISALFDHNPEKVGQQIGDLTIYGMSDMPDVLSSLNIQMAIMAVPARGAQEATDALVASGVSAILNYAPIIVQVPHNVKIRHIDPVVALQSMTYYIDDSAKGSRAGLVRNGNGSERVRSGKLD